MLIVHREVAATDMLPTSLTKGCSKSDMSCLEISKSGQIKEDLIQTFLPTFCDLQESEHSPDQTAILGFLSAHQPKHKDPILRSTDHLCFSLGSEAQCLLVARCQKTPARPHIRAEWLLYHNTCTSDQFSRKQNNTPRMLF